MNKIKILQFSIANAGGGITQYVLKNWEYIDKERFHFDFVTLSPKLDFEESLIQQGCKIFHLTCYAEEDLYKFTKEMDLILSEGYDMIHLHTQYWRSFAVEEIALKHKLSRIIVHSHASQIDIEDEDRRNKAINLHELLKEQFSSSMATDFCACSQVAATWLFGNKIPRNRIRILDNAIDLNQFNYNEDIRNQYRKMFNLENNFVIGHVGRFTYLKNHEFLIDVFSEVCKIHPKAKLILIGIGELETGIRETIKINNLQDKVLFLGKRNDVNNLMQAMDLFAFPSRFEGLGIALVEAQASGLKCLASESVSNEGKVTGNVDFEPLVVDTWVNQILFYSQGYKRESVNDLAIMDNYSMSKQIKQLERFYEGN